MSTATPSIVDVSNTTQAPESCTGDIEDTNVSPYSCKAVFDGILCWPTASANSTVILRCPTNVKSFDPTKFVERRCSSEGRWQVKPGSGTNSNNIQGWTNYTSCYKNEIRDLVAKLGTESERQQKMNVADRTRYLEFIGLSLSLVALLISLVIFYRFRSLRNNRTRIHKNLFIAMVIQVIIRLTLYIDQAVTRHSDAQSNSVIENTSYLCEGIYILLEYAKTAMFLWMFVEGLYLHNVVTVTVFQGRFPHIWYCCIGWGSPIILTAIWATITALQKGIQTCWFGYNLTPMYWIMEGPRLTVICLNMIFLLNIIRVLVVKLRQSRTSEVEQVRKAVRAAIVLLPLLGITNLLNMVDSSVDQSPLKFALWTYSSYFLTSFQGFFIAMIYCFLNGEVRAAILKSISVYMSLRGHHDWAARRPSMFSGNNPTVAETENQAQTENRVLFFISDNPVIVDNKNSDEIECGVIEENERM